VCRLYLPRAGIPRSKSYRQESSNFWWHFDGNKKLGGIEVVFASFIDDANILPREGKFVRHDNVHLANL
jgi:hypothetical protein